MFYEKDWIMRQIEMLIQFVAKVVLQNDTAKFSVYADEEQTDTQMLQGQIFALLNRGEICQAENILFDSFIPGNAHWLSAALDFYSRLNAMDDRELAACNFSREEIGEGLNDILRLSGLEALKIE